MNSSFYTKGICGNGMVLQRNSVNCVYGIAPKSSIVEFSFRNLKWKTEADENGNWKFEFNPGKEGGPDTLTLKCESKTITFTDVFTGEVWVNSGQSNAQLPMERMKYSYPEEFRLPENPYIRMITIPITYAFNGEKDSVENPTWLCANKDNLGEMSGTAYFFAKKLAKDLRCPIGIINASQGGSPVSAWMDYDSLKEVGRDDYVQRADNCKNPEFINEKIAAAQKAEAEWNTNIYNADKGMAEEWFKTDFSAAKEWQTVCIPGSIDLAEKAGIVWLKKEIVLSKEQAEEFNSKVTNLWLGTIIDADKVWVNGTEVGVTFYTYPPRRDNVPNGTLKEGSNTITVRVQLNSSFGKIHFYEEKPYCLFTDDVYVCPVAFRNVEKKSTPETNTGVKISLEGEWKACVGAQVENAPAGLFFEWEPTALYNAMLAPAFKHAIAGFLWYQGESDAYQSAEYKKLLKKMIELWRRKFVYASSHNAPFVVMQLPNWANNKDEYILEENCSWAELRDAQAYVVETTPNTALAVAIDAGEWNDLHPEKKLTCGTRAAMQALRIAYDYDYPTNPIIKLIRWQKDSITITFENVNKSLYVIDNDEGKVSGFTILYIQDGKKHLMELKDVTLINNHQVEIKLPQIDGEIFELLYLWADNPCANLYTDLEIPVAPFRCAL